MSKDTCIKLDVPCEYSIKGLRANKYSEIENWCNHPDIIHKFAIHIYAKQITRLAGTVDNCPLAKLLNIQGKNNVG